MDFVAMMQGIKRKMEQTLSVGEVITILGTDEELSLKGPRYGEEGTK